MSMGIWFQISKMDKIPLKLDQWIRKQFTKKVNYIFLVWFEMVVILSYLGTAAGFINATFNNKLSIFQGIISITILGFMFCLIIFVVRVSYFSMTDKTRKQYISRYDYYILHFEKSRETYTKKENELNKLLEKYK